MRAGKRYRFESWLVEDKGRVVTAQAEGFDDESGERVASGGAKCMRLREQGTR
jgi:acyl-coenzyme A thioesterase PaaI-like protein